MWLRYTFKQKARAKGAELPCGCSPGHNLGPTPPGDRQAGLGIWSWQPPGWVCEAGRLVFEERDNLHPVCIAVITSFCSPSVFMETLCGDAANLSRAERKRQSGLCLSPGSRWRTQAPRSRGEGGKNEAERLKGSRLQMWGSSTPSQNLPDPSSGLCWTKSDILYPPGPFLWPAPFRAAKTTGIGPSLL